MSRAFVNEDNAAAQADQPVERQVSEQPNYVTSQGLAQLQARVAELQTQHAEQSAKGEQADKQRLADLQRDLRYFNQRLSSAQVAVAATSRDKVQIGKPLLVGLLAFGCLFSMQTLQFGDLRLQLRQPLRRDVIGLRADLPFDRLIGLCGGVVFVDESTAHEFLLV